jgi:hypothetical protein
VARKAKFAAGLSLAIFFSLLVSAQQYSSSFQELLSEVNRLYIKPKGWVFQNMEREAPEILAAVIGHALRQQYQYARKDRNLVPIVNGLQKAVKNYLMYLARASDYMDSRGNDIDAKYLWDVAMDHMSGNKDREIAEFFGVKVGSMPPLGGGMAAQKHMSGPQAQPSGGIEDLSNRSASGSGIQFGENTGFDNQISLLGQRPVETRHAYDQAETYFERCKATYSRYEKARDAGNDNAADSFLEKAEAQCKKACDIGLADACSYVGERLIEEWD